MRRALGDELAAELLCVDAETIALGDVRVDADDFRWLAASSSLDDWRAALELYRGDLLEELDAELLLAPRAELRELYLATLERLCTALTQAGHFANALSVAARGRSIVSCVETGRCDHDVLLLTPAVKPRAGHDVVFLL
ncbi:MAG TPA: hypothetical protein DEP84_29020 [Chloroflexi bacterium]|nr:hypothetical protein [Chloroflexota bacterium]